MKDHIERGHAIAENSKVFEVTALTGAYYFASKPAFTPRWECYDFAQILLIRRGTGQFYTEHGSYRFGPGMMLYRPAYGKTMYEWDDDKAGLAIIDFVCPSPAMAALPTEPTLLFGEESATLFDLVKTAVRVCESVENREGVTTQRPRAEVPQVVFSYLYSSLERFLAMVYCRTVGIDLLQDETQKVSRHLRDSRLVSEIKAFLEEHVTEQLTLGDVCARFWVGQTALTGKFRREAGCSLMEYFTERKIAEAQRRIATESATFTELAETLGFSSVNYFSKVFKQRTGMTPTEYSRFVSKQRAGDEEI